jgi:hypothetical protein
MILDNFDGFLFFKFIEIHTILAQNPQILCPNKINIPKIIFGHSTGRTHSRPGMYIGKLGDGSSADDGIYILVKEVLDNCIDDLQWALEKLR